MIITAVADEPGLNSTTEGCKHVQVQEYQFDHPGLQLVPPTLGDTTCRPGWPNGTLAPVHIRIFQPYNVCSYSKGVQTTCNAQQLLCSMPRHDCQLGLVGAMIVLVFTSANRWCGLPNLVLAYGLFV